MKSGMSTKNWTIHTLAGELTVVLAVKIALLLLAGFLLFGSNHRPSIDPNVITHHMFE